MSVATGESGKAAAARGAVNSAAATTNATIAILLVRLIIVIAAPPLFAYSDRGRSYEADVAVSSGIALNRRQDQGNPGAFDSTEATRGDK
jgi:hypothetical protein